MSRQERVEHRNGAGFTLVELALVVAVIIIIATIALPSFLSSRMSANESAAISTLRAISAGQTNFQVRRVVENEIPADGMGEYGYLGELSGSVNLRGGGAPLGPPTLGSKLGIVQQGVVTTGGYHFMMFLPGPTGAGIPEDLTGGKAAFGTLDPDLCERFWVCYAWPAQRNTSGRRAFVINQEGDVYSTDNAGAGQAYDGIANPPPFDAAYPMVGAITGRFAGSGTPGSDGGTWQPLK